MTSNGDSACASVHCSRNSGFLAIAAALAIAIAFIGVMLQIIDFPFETQPDEVSKVMQIQQGWYNYNHPLLMLELGHAANVLLRFADPQAVVELGRSLAVIAGGFAIVATFLLAREVLPRGVAVAATFAVAVLPAMTVHARYFKEDIFMLPFLLLALALLVQMQRKPTPSLSLMLGGAIGLAASAKYIAIIVLPFSLVFVLLNAGSPTQEWRRNATAAALITVSACAAFALVQVPALINLGASSSGLLSGIAKASGGHEVRLPVSTTFGIFHLTNSLLPSLGLPLLLLGIFGMSTAWLAPPERRQPLLILATFTLLWYVAHELSPFKPYPGFARYMLPLAPLLVILAAAFVYELGRRFWSGSASAWITSVAIIVAAMPALYVSVRIIAPAREDPRWVISSITYGSATRTAFDRYTRYSWAPGATERAPPTSAVADIFVTSSFVYDRYAALRSPHGQPSATRQRRARYGELFQLAYLEVSNGRPTYAFFNPIIRIVALDGDPARLAPIEAALREATPSFSVRLVNRGGPF